MTRSDAKPHPATPPRPRLWVDGQQRPRFNLSAFARVTSAMASQALAPEIRDAAQRLGQLGPAIATGQIRLTPRRWAAQDARVGRAVLGLAALLQGAHDLLVPAPPDQTLAYPDIIRSQGVPPQTQTRADEPTLQAIRSAMFFDHPDPTPKTAAIAPLAGNNSPLCALVCRAVLAVLMAFALPMAALRAGWFHLQGGDLADWSCQISPFRETITRPGPALSLWRKPFTKR